MRRRLIKKGKAYICFCPAEEVKENRNSGKDCEHKKQASKENLKLWKEMLAKKQKEGILRFKGDMKDLNSAMRDPTLFRIKTEPHYRQGSKYAVWPTYDFNTPIIDSIKGITDTLRSKEYELRDELYYTMLDLLGLRKPRIHSFARLEIENNMTSKRKLKELIKGGSSGDGTTQGSSPSPDLRRRGITPEAIREFVLRFGMSKTESKVSIDMLLAENRKIVDSNRKKALFHRETQKDKGKRNSKRALQEIKIKAHPNADMGYREYKLS